MFFRSKWIPLKFLILALIIVLSACGGTSTLPINHPATPSSQTGKLVDQLTQTLSAYCNALKNGDSQTALGLSSAHMTVLTLSQIRYYIFYKNAHTTAITSCQVESVTLSQDGNTATGIIVYMMGNGRILRIEQPLYKENGGIWRVLGYEATILASQPASSGNYAGYAVIGSNANADVKASWIQPKAQTKCSLSFRTSEVAFWIGLGGILTHKGIEQIGTGIVCDPFGRLTYQVAWEMVPAKPFILDPKQYPLTPGDTINAEVSYIGNNQFTLTINDTKNDNKLNWTFSTIQNQPQQYLDLSSKEWIVELPQNINELEDFGNVNFSNCSIDSDFGSTIHQIVMNFQNSTRALPSNLIGATAFSVQWISG